MNTIGELIEYFISKGYFVRVEKGADLWIELIVSNGKHWDRSRFREIDKLLIALHSSKGVIDRLEGCYVPPADSPWRQRA